MKLFAYKKTIILFVLMLTFIFSSICFAAIERTVEPFTQAVSYSTKYSFTDSDRNMHSIELIRSIKPLKGVIGGKTHETDTYFLLNFSLPQGVTLGDTFDVQVTQRHINALPLASYLVSGIGFSSAPTARTGHKDLPDMTKVAIEKGDELLVRVNFSRGRGLYTIPAAIVKEWAEFLKDPEALYNDQQNIETATSHEPASAEQEQTNENKK